MLWRAEVAQLVRLAAEPLHERPNKPGLADPWLTDEAHHTTLYRSSPQARIARERLTPHLDPNSGTRDAAE